MASAASHKQRLVVVGAGMAAFALVKRLQSEGGLEHYRVTLVGEESHPCYDRVHLTDCFSGKTPNDLLLAPANWYREHGVELLTGTRVASIDRAERKVAAASGDSLPYDHLVLATGSHPFVPPIDGTDLPGVFVYRTIEDIRRIQAYAAGRRTAAVLGGGLLGLEAAKALHDVGLDTHVAEVAPGLMPRQLNAEAADLLKRKIESLGVTVHLQRRAEQVRASGGGLQIDFTGHESIGVEMVVMSAGIRPNDALAREAGLDVGERGGVAIDSRLGTSDPHIWAIGECAALDGVLFGLVGPCYDMAETLADNLIHQARGEVCEAEFVGASQASRLKLMGVDVSTFGVPIGEADDATLLTSDTPAYSRSLIVSRRRVVGALGVGEWPERERLSGLIAEGGRASGRQLRRFRETGSLWGDSQGDTIFDWPAASTVCSCLGVTRGELTDAVQAGATDAAALATATGASTVCGSCRDLVCELAGDPQAALRPKGSRALLAGSIAALVVLAALLTAGPAPAAESVRSSWRQIDLFRQDSLVRQATGFSLLGVALVASSLSLRKRFAWLQLGDFGAWRGAHGLLGAATVVGFVLHAGTRLGHNLTLALATTFLLLNLVGAMTGVTAALESRFQGPTGRRLRTWRPRLTRLHIWLLWPLPALVLFHIISVYYY